MRNLRKFSVFLLFAALFAVLAYSLFALPLTDMALNVLYGSGERTYVSAVEGADGKVYVLRENKGGAYSLLALQDGRCVAEKAVKNGLPADFEPEALTVAQNGAVVLGVYSRSGVELGEYTLYAAQDGEIYKLLLQAPLSGETMAQRRQSAGVRALVNEGSLVRLTVLQEGEFNKVIYDPAAEQGLVADGSLALEQAQTQAAEQETARQNAWTLVCGGGFDPARITYLAPTAQGGALALVDEARLYAFAADGSITDHSAALYRTPWQSALLLVAVLLGVLVLAYAFYYLVCEAKKLYFPLVIKNLILLTLVGFVAVSAAMLAFIAPAYRGGVREDLLSSMRAQAQQLTGQQDMPLAQATQALARADARYADGAAYSLVKDENGLWTVASSADNTAAGIDARLLGIDAEQQPPIMRFGGQTYYIAYAEASSNSLVCLRMNALAVERGIDDTLLYIALGCYGFALLLVLFALCALGGAARGARRVTRGIDLMSAGAPHVRVVHSSGDEMQALAAAFNDLSGAMEEKREDAALEGSAYLRFVPSRLVALLGASDIEQVDKNTSASHEMAMMVVRFAFPKGLYQSDTQKLFDNINEVFAHIAGAVSGAGGAIYNFTYDGFDAVFESGAKAAVGAAVVIRQALLDLNTERETRGEAAVALRVALDHGMAMMGVVGDEDRVVPTVVSAGLNTARSLVHLADVLDANILCTTPVMEAAGEYGLRYIGKYRDGGADLRVYEIYDGDPYSMRVAKENMREAFSNGVYALYGGDFSQAKRLFMEIARRQSEDGVARHYLYLVDRFEKNPPERIGLNE